MYKLALVNPRSRVLRPYKAAEWGWGGKGCSVGI